MGHELACPAPPPVAENPLRRTAVLHVGARQALATQEGVAVFVLPAEGIVDKASFHAAVNEVLPLEPPVLLPNWDALADSLWQGLHQHPAERLLLLWPGARALAAAAGREFVVAVDILAQVAELLADETASGGRPKQLQVVIEDCARFLFCFGGEGEKDDQAFLVDAAHADEALERGIDAADAFHRQLHPDDPRPWSDRGFARWIEPSESFTPGQLRALPIVDFGAEPRSEDELLAELQAVAASVVAQLAEGEQLDQAAGARLKVLLVECAEAYRDVDVVPKSVARLLAHILQVPAVGAEAAAFAAQIDELIHEVLR